MLGRPVPRSGRFDLPTRNGRNDEAGRKCDHEGAQDSVGHRAL